MIRKATKYDKTNIIEMMKQFRSESPVKHLYGEDNEQYWSGLLDNIFAGQGEVFVADNVGLLMCVVLPSIWNDKVFGLHEVAWYVVPEHRGGTVGHRLFKTYLEYAQEMKRQGRVRYFTMSKMVSSPDLNYSRYGFAKVDENWIQ